MRKKIPPKICFLSIDVEPDFGKSGFLGVENLYKILNILKENNISGTLFVCGEVLERYGDLIRGFSKDFEIASHSFSHLFWTNLSFREREKEIKKFKNFYFKIFNKDPIGFRAPSHLIDNQGLNLLEKNGFVYDSSVLPHYPPFKKYRGYQGKAPLMPYFPDYQNYRKKGKMKILEIPVKGLYFGVPLTGSWISKLPLSFYQFLLSFPYKFLTLNLHSWDSLKDNFFYKLEKILEILRNKNFYFLKGEEIYELFSKNRKDI